MKVKKKPRRGKLNGLIRYSHGIGEGSAEGVKSPEDPQLPLVELVKAQLLAEADLKRSLESRAMTVITASGAFVTLLLGFASWNSQQHRLAISQSVKISVAAGVCFLLLAGLGSIGVNAPSRIAKFDADALLALIEKRPSNASITISQREAAEAQTKLLVSSTIQNRAKARLLLVSICAQLVGLSLVSFAVLQIILM